MMGFAEQLGRRIGPGARRRPPRAGLKLTVLWFICTVSIGASIAMTLSVFGSRTGQQLLLDTIASLGLGTPEAGARVDAVRCSYARRTGRYAISGYQCDVAIRHGRYAQRADLHTSGLVSAPEAGAVVRIGAALAVAWPADVMASRWMQISPLALGFVLVLPLARFSGREISRTHRVLAVLRAGAPREVTLLRRRASRKRSDPGVWWDFAYDHDGARRFGRMLLEADPAILDRARTRGVALVTPDGEAVLMRGDGSPLAFGVEERAWIADMTHALRHAHRRAAPGLDDLAARLAPGPERDFVAAFDASWHAFDAAAADAAIVRRHDAAAALKPAAVDRLLALCCAETRRR